MGHRRRKIAVAVVLVTLLIAAGVGSSAVPAHGGTPSSGTLSPANPMLSYTGGPYLVPNQSGQLVSPPLCTGTPTTQCDQYALSVDTSGATADYASTHSVSISVTWPDQGDEYDIYVLDTGGNVIASSTNGNPPQVATFPAVTGAFTVTVVPAIVKPTDQNNTGEPFTATITLGPNPSDTPATPDTGTPPRFENDIPPTGPGDLAGIDADEPSIGANWNTGNVMYQALLQSLRVRFDDTTSPAGTTWAIVPATTSVTTLDPILFTDHTTGRSFVSQLFGTTSLSSISDDDGAHWTPSTGGSFTSGVDHQTIGGGPFAISPTVPITTLPTTSYPHAVYYCSQDIATAFCALSRDGGETYEPSVPIYTINQCIGIHGHVKVAPDGTVYVPNKGCDLLGSGLGSLYAHQGMAVSTDNGQTWTTRYVPDSTTALHTDPSIGIGTGGTVYFGYQNGDGHPLIAVTHDRGKTWTPSVDVGQNIVGEPGVQIQNSTFPEVVAGDDDRAAYAFLGTSSGGNYEDITSFHGVWHLYVATTYDGGRTWSTVDATPNDPMQRGSICNGGTTCGNDRNLYDFNDITVDKEGRILVAYADGCLGGCVTTEPNTYTHLATIARQTGGRRLFARYDPATATSTTVPLTPSVTATQDTATGAVTLQWVAPDNGGAAINGYNVYRGTTPGSETLLATGVNPPLTLSGPIAVRPTLAYTDTNAVTGQTYYYQISAVNGQGEGPRSPEVSPAPTTAPDPYALPGILAVTDTIGDQQGGVVNSDLDIQSLAVAQPPTTTPTLAFTIKVTDLSTIKPNREWRVRFFGPPNGTKYYVAMKADASAAVTFEYGTIGTTENVSGSIPGTYDQAAGTITLYLPTNLIPGLDVGQALGTLGVDTYTDTQGGKGEAGVNTATDMAPDSGFDSGSKIYTIQPFAPAPATAVPATATTLPATATETTAPPAATSTPAPPAATNTPVPASATIIAVSPAATGTSVPAPATSTPVLPTATGTPVPAVASATPTSGSAGSGPRVGGTATAVPPSATSTGTPGTGAPGTSAAATSAAATARATAPAVTGTPGASGHGTPATPRPTTISQPTGGRARITLVPASARVGDRVRVLGSGFGPNELITLALNGEALATATIHTDRNGRFTALITAPDSIIKGANTVSAVGASSRRTALATLQGLRSTQTYYLTGGVESATDHTALALLNTGPQAVHIGYTLYSQTSDTTRGTLTVGPHADRTVPLASLSRSQGAFGVALSTDRPIAAALTLTRDGRDGDTVLATTGTAGRWYLAEGYTGLSFHESVALLNTDPTRSARVTLHVLPLGGGAGKTLSVDVRPHTNAVVDINRVLPRRSVSIVVDASRPMVVERTLTFSSDRRGSGYGLTTRAGTTTAATSWLFAEGTTTNRFETYFTILNPGARAAHVRARFYGSRGLLASRGIVVRSLSRANIKLNSVLRASGVASVLTSDQPIVVERPEYFGSPNAPRIAGSDVYGRNGVGQRWSFAGGNTRGQSLFVLLYNPAAVTARLVVTVYGADGRVLSRPVSVPAGTRATLDVRRVFGRIADVSGLTVQSTNGQGVVAEQTVFAPDHTTLQSTQGLAQ